MTDKMLIDRAVVEQALKALERADRIAGYKNNWAETVALRAALEQPQVEREPVAWADEIIDCLQAQYNTDMIQELESGDALIRLDDAIAAVEEAEQRYTHPQPPRQPLTKEEIAVIAAACGGLASDFVVSIASAIEVAHGIGGEK